MQAAEISDSIHRVPASSTKRRSLIAACLAHALHDGYTDSLYAFLPVWQAQFGLSYAGLAVLRQTPCPFVVVLGHPGYYSRFGFEPASMHGIRCKWNVPDEAFMILVLDESRMCGASGVARYRSEFDAAT